jgi:hypothetical protein
MYKESAIAKSTISLTVAVVILAGSLVFVELGPQSPTRSVTVTSTSTAATTATDTETIENYVTTSVAGSASDSVSGNATSSSSVSANGIQLATSIDTFGVYPAEALQVSLSISNTLSAVNDINTSSDWLFQGAPVAIWPECYFSLPVEVAVLDGNYSAGELPLLSGTGVSYQCSQGVEVNHLIFQPDSDEANVSGRVCDCANESLGPYKLSLSFITDGYWDLQDLSSNQSAPIIVGEPYQSPLASLPFVPGTYTVAVEDEWGQVDVLHFQILTKSYTPSAELVGFSLCASNCYYPAPFLSGTVYFNSTSPAYLFQLSVNGTREASYGQYPAPPLSNGPFVVKATLTSPVVAGDHYAITFQFAFDDGTNANATTIVVAS